MVQCDLDAALYSTYRSLITPGLRGTKRFYMLGLNQYIHTMNVLARFLTINAV